MNNDAVTEAGRRISNPETYRRNEWAGYFSLLRREDPVHYVSESVVGPYWAITKFDDIKEIEANFAVFSSAAENGGIMIQNIPPEQQVRSFFLADPPIHSEQRATVNVIGLPRGVSPMEGLIRQTAQAVLDALPRGELFDWVDRVSIEMTSVMLAALMAYPVERRRELVRWSDIMTADLNDPDSPISSQDERQAEMLSFLEAMEVMWVERERAAPTLDLVSLLAHNPIMSALPQAERLGTLITFLVGGNDTTRNTISGGLLALAQFPAEFEKLRRNPDLVPSFVQESLRWQTPVMNMRRTALTDIEFKGRAIRKGEKVVLWYISANRDDSVIDRPDQFLVDRDRPAPQLTFGYGIHRCLGARLAQAQLQIFWEEFMKRDIQLKVVKEPEMAYSLTFRSVKSLLVSIA